MAKGASVSASSSINLAQGSSSVSTLNIGSFGGSDTAGTIITPIIQFGRAGGGTINFNQTDTATLTSSIVNIGTVNQLGTGTTILTGSNSYSGTTLITNGTLLANNTAGSAVGTSVVTATNSGTLGGNGTIGGATTIASGGSLTPGSGGTGSLSFTNGLTLATGSTTTFLINATNNFTSINLIGNSVNYGGGLTFTMASYTPSAVDLFTVFNLTGGATESGDFSGVELGSIFLTDDNGLWSGTNNGVVYQFSKSTGVLSVISVPEPSTYALFGMSLVALTLGIAARRRLS